MQFFFFEVFPNGTLIKVLQQWGPGYEIHLDLKLNTNGYNESTWQDSYDIFQFTTHNGWKNASRIPFMFLQRTRNITEIDIQSQIGFENGYLHRIHDVQYGIWNKIILKQIKEVSKLNCKILILFLSRLMVTSTSKYLLMELNRFL